MKKRFSVFFCFLIVIFMTTPAAAGNRLFDFDPGSVETIEIRMGAGTDHIMNAAENAELIQKIIRTLNDFEYDETEQIGPTEGWYMELRVIDRTGTKQFIEISLNGAYAPNDNADTRTKYISVDPDYFGESWIHLLFPYPLTDVKMWQNASVKSLYDKGLMLGTSETTFSPDAVMTRGMFVTVLGRMAKISEADYQENTFEDVKETDYFCPYVSWGYQSGIVKGTADKSFSPNDPVTREQAVVLLARYAEALELEYPTTTNPFKPRFIDIENTSQEFQEKLPVLHAASVFPPLEDNEIFDPTGTMTRKEVTEIFENTYQVLYEW